MSPRLCPWLGVALLAAIAACLVLSFELGNTNKKLREVMSQPPKVVEKIVTVTKDSEPCPVAPVCDTGYQVKVGEHYIWIYKDNTPIYFVPRAFSNNQ